MTVLQQWTGWSRNRNVVLLSLLLQLQLVGNIPSDTVVDLTTPLQITLSLYQDYPWTIIANQTIERIFSVKGQIGQAYFYPDIREASVNLPKDKGLDVISVTDLKLGPSGATYNGVNGVPELQWEKTKNFA